MFRRGGSTGEGITSGLSRPGYNRGRVVNPGGYGGDDPYELLKGYPDFRKEYQKHVGDRPRSTNLNDFLINFGLNMASASPTGNVLQTAAMQAKEPFAQFQQTKAYEDTSKRDEERDLIKSYVASRADALSESDQSMFSKEQQSAAIAGYTDSLFKLGEDLAAGTITKEEHDKKRQKIFNQLSPYMKDNQALEKLWAVPEYADEAYREYKTQILADESPYLDNNGEQVIEEGDVITVAEWFERPENKAELRQKATNMYLKEAQELEVGAVTGWAGAKGGRAGYQQGELVEQADVNIQTPQGDVNMQETVEEGTGSDQLSYEELRSRLPVEITDDIIRLMVSSPEALTDFAEIQTQQDVDTFNSKYGVNLVLPSEA
jgi:hypothetical protein